MEEKNSMKMRGILSISIPVGSIGSGEFQPATKENVNFNSSRFNWKWRARCNITVPFVISIPVGSIGRKPLAKKDFKLKISIPVGSIGSVRLLKL